MTKFPLVLRYAGILWILAFQAPAAESQPKTHELSARQVENEDKNKLTSKATHDKIDSESELDGGNVKKGRKPIDGDYLPQETVDALDKVPVFERDINELVLPDGAPITDYLTPSDIVEPSLKRENALRSK